MQIKKKRDYRNLQGLTTPKIDRKGRFMKEIERQNQIARMTFSQDVE